MHDEEREREGSTAFALTIPADGFFGSVNGLVGYESEEISANRICNISTQEITPWITLTMSTDATRSPYFEIGFDPVTKKHKVVCIWHIFQHPDDVCDVLTVGDYKWRRVECPPFMLQLECLHRDHTVYLNGFIYYCTLTFMKPGKLGNDKIVAFDVGAEKFRVITVPDFILNQPRHFYLNGTSSNHLIELDGRLALVSRMSDYTAKLWVLNTSSSTSSCQNWTEVAIELLALVLAVAKVDDVHGKNEEKNTSSSTSSCQNWTEVAIELPYRWSTRRYMCFHSVVGTNQIIIESRYGDTKFRLHLYNWRTKSCKKIDISGFKYHPAGSRFSILVESLLHVQ